jgi:hypothetical protein
MAQEIGFSEGALVSKARNFHVPKSREFLDYLCNC